MQNTKRRRRTRALSELEAVTLGCIERNQPCTAYAVRRHFLQSPASHFSGSAGAIYPLVRRLAKAGLLASESATTGRRRALAYRLTATGMAALRDWLRTTLDPSAAFTIDPLRTRILFLSALTPAEQRRWLDVAEAALRAQLPLLADLLNERQDDPYLRLAHDNARREARVRLAWLRQARSVLDLDG